MNKYHQIAIEMKYEGKSYAEISKSLKNVISVGTIRNWFMEAGKLYIPYQQYESGQNIERSAASIHVFKRESENAAKVIVQALAKSLKAGKFDEAVRYAEKILDRSGNVVIRKSEVDVDDKTSKKVDTYEQFIAELGRLGIDPKTGLRMAKAKVDKDQVLQA